jgi:chemotaxis protein MotA
MLNSLFKWLLGFVIIIVSSYLAIFVYHSAPTVGVVFHLPSAVLVGGLIVGVSLFLAEFRDYGRFFSFVFSYSPSRELARIHKSEQLFEESLNVYYNSGTQAFSQFVKNNNLPHIWQILATKLEIKVPVPDIKDILEHKVRKITAILEQDTTIVRQISTLAPSMGMIATILGLVKLLADLTDMAALGPNMALALLGTLYGVAAGNVLFVPLALQIDRRKELVLKNHENIIFWLSALEEKKPAFYLKNKLRELSN